MKYSTVGAASIAEIASEAVRDSYLVENCDLRGIRFLVVI
jgi:hypothetical protein